MTYFRCRFLLPLLALALSWALPANSQDGAEGGARLHEAGRGMPDEDFEVSRALASAGELPSDLRERVSALRASQEVIRSAWIAGYRPSAGASFEELKAAQESFQSEFADEIESSKRLRSELLLELRAGGLPVARSLEEKWKSDESYAELREAQSSLAKAWAAVRLELGESPTRLELFRAKKRFRDKYADLIARCRTLSSEIRGENGPVPAFGREGLPSELLDLRRDMATTRNQVRRRYSKSLEEMESSPDETHRQKVLEEMREQHREMGARRRQALERARD